VLLIHIDQFYIDNIGATYLTSNPFYHARTKHTEIDYHFVRDMVAKKLLDVCFISGKNQLADVLTNPLPAVRFGMLWSNLNVHPSTSSLRGRIGSKSYLAKDNAIDLNKDSDKALEFNKDSSS